MTGEELRARYFGAMRAADLDGVLALFDDQAAVILPNGSEYTGRAGLEDMYRGIFGGTRPNPSPGPVTGSGDYWAVEVETTLPDGRLRNTANFFRLNDHGRILEMRSYTRG